MSCSHPIREGQGFSKNFDVVGSHATDAWGTCKTCGAWWWTVTDDGKFQYEDQWEIPTDLAKRALLGHDPDALADLFVTKKLPHGPLWDWSGALVEIFRALTPNSADDVRARALKSADAKGENWEQAIRTLEQSAQASVPQKAVPFDADARVGRTFTEHYEVGNALVLFTGKPELLRLEPKGLVQLPLGAIPTVLARSPDRILLRVGPGIVVLDAAGNATSHIVEGDFTAEALDDGWWLFVSKTRDSIQLHLPDGRPKVKLPRKFSREDTWMPPPRKLGGGWIVSNLTDDDGKTQALTLFDADFKTAAYSEGIDGERFVTPIDADSFWAGTLDDRMERWVRNGKALDRAQHFESRSSFVCGDTLITDTREGEVVGRGMDGRFRWQWKRSTDGATYGIRTKHGVLLWDNRRAHELGTDGTVRKTFAVESADVHSTTTGIVYVKTGAEVWAIEDDAVSFAVGTDFDLEATTGDCAILRNDEGTCLVVGIDGIRGTFDAPDARFEDTRGLWVIEGDRLRVIFPR